MRVCKRTVTTRLAKELALERRKLEVLGLIFDTHIYFTISATLLSKSHIELCNIQPQNSLTRVYRSILMGKVMEIRRKKSEPRTIKKANVTRRVPREMGFDNAARVSRYI